MNQITWDQLKTFVNSLDENQLKKQVFIIIDDNSFGTPLIGMEQLPEDVYCHKDDPEDCGQLEILKELYDEDFNESDFILSTEKGTPFLYLYDEMTDLDEEQ